jgi:2-polyprenyl-6-methoxyphenol hydroxylase-like FAD-dependent oxidoreductase
MSSIVITGAGVVGLTTAMLLADDGHEVTVLEHDPAPVVKPSLAWEAWKRRGIAQFFLPHFFPARFRIEIEQNLPRVAKALDEAGALRYNPLAMAPPKVTGRWRDGDGEFEALTGRRPVMEAVLAAAAEATPGITVRRGVAVARLVTAFPADSQETGVPHVAGVRTASGEQVSADLVVHAAGRRSRLADWLADCGAARPAEEAEESGFVYYCRHFRSPDRTMPRLMGPMAQDHGSITSLMLPADNGTWAIVVGASGKDTALHGLRDPARWTALVRRLPLVAHWLDGEPVEDRIVTMSRIEDRHLRLVVGGKPVATGVVAVGDAWACTDPLLGRGVSIGAMHGLALRDLLRRAGLADPARFAAEFDAASMAAVEPWYRATLFYTRHRLAEIDAEIRGERYEPADPEWELIRSLNYAASRDPDCLRAVVSIASALRPPGEVMTPDLRATALAVGGDWREAPRNGPSRSELVSIATSSSNDARNKRTAPRRPRRSYRPTCPLT